MIQLRSVRGINAFDDFSIHAVENRIGERGVMVRFPHILPAVPIDHKLGDRVLARNRNKIGCDDASARTHRALEQRKQIAGFAVIEMMQHRDDNRSIEGRMACKFRFLERSGVELASPGESLLRKGDIVRADIVSDIFDAGGQIRQDLAGTATNVENALPGLRANIVIGEVAPELPCADRGLQRLVGPRMGQMDRSPVVIWLISALLS
jgi:hypothetical protein